MQQQRPSSASKTRTPLAMKCSCASHKNYYSSLISPCTSAGLLLTRIYQVQPEIVLSADRIMPRGTRSTQPAPYDAQSVSSSLDTVTGPPHKGKSPARSALARTGDDKSSRSLLHLHATLHYRLPSNGCPTLFGFCPVDQPHR